MADLEEHAFRRDKSFVVRLVLVLAVATVAGLAVFVQLTSDRTASCAARTFGGVDTAADGATPEPTSP